MHKRHPYGGSYSFRPAFSTLTGSWSSCRHWTRSGWVKPLSVPSASGTLIITRVRKVRPFPSLYCLLRYDRLYECTLWYQGVDQTARSSPLRGCPILLRQRLCIRERQSSFGRTQRMWLTAFVAFASRECPLHWYRRNWADLKRTWHCCRMKRRPWSFCPFVFARMWKGVRIFFMHWGLQILVLDFRRWHFFCRHRLRCRLGLWGRV